MNPSTCYTTTQQLMFGHPLPCGFVKTSATGFGQKSHYDYFDKPQAIYIFISLKCSHLIYREDPEDTRQGRILFGNVEHRTLSRHQHILVMIFLEHSQRAVRHHDLVLRYLQIKQTDYHTNQQLSSYINALWHATCSKICNLAFKSL